MSSRYQFMTFFKESHNMLIRNGYVFIKDQNTSILEKMAKPKNAVPVLEVSNVELADNIAKDELKKRKKEDPDDDNVLKPAKRKRASKTVPYTDCLS